MKKNIWIVALLLALVPGCGPKEETTSFAPEASAPPAAEAKSFDAATAGTLKGRVLFEGEAPKQQPISVKGNPECALLHKDGQIAPEALIVSDGRLQNVFVYVKQGLEGYSFPVPSEAVVIDNKNCIYVPHVAGVQVGQPVEFLNSDSTLHNIHSFPKNSKQFNLGLPFAGMKQVKKIDTEEVMIPLKCDVHPWMLGYLGVLRHPYFSVTGAEGSFELKNLPPGEYVIEAWHEKLGTQSQTVAIGSQETKEIEFKFSAA